MSRGWSSLHRLFYSFCYRSASVTGTQTIKNSAFLTLTAELGLAYISIPSFYNTIRRFAEPSLGKPPSKRFFQAQAVRLSPCIVCFRLLQVAKPQAGGGQYSCILRQGCCRQLPAEPALTILRRRELCSNKGKNTPPIKKRSRHKEYIANLLRFLIGGEGEI